MKKTIVIVLVLIILVIFVCLVWFSGHKPAVVPTQPTETAVSSSTDVTERNVTSSANDQSIEQISESEEPTAPEQPEPADTAAEIIAVSPDRLTEGQMSLLETFGIDPNSITITPAMVKCAEEAVGTERLEAIQAGETPGVFEGLKLAACYGS